MDLLVNVDKFDAFNAELGECEKMLSSVRSTLTSVQSRINSRFLRDCGIYGQMGSISSRLTKEKDAVRKMRTAIDSVERSYRSMEENNIRACGVMTVSSGDGSGTGAVPSGGGGAGGGGFRGGSGDSFTWWDWGDTWSMVEKFGLVGTLISTFGGLFTNGMSDFGDWMSFAKDGIGYIGDLAKNLSNPKFDWKTLFGFNIKTVKDMSTSKYFDDFFDDLNFGKATKVTDKISVAAKWAGYALSFGTEIYENFTEEDNSFGRSLLEGIVEGGTSIGIGVLAGWAANAGVGALCTLVGVAGAPAVLVGAATVGIAWLADSVVEHFTGKDIGEHVADAVGDAVERNIERAKKVADVIGKGAKAVYDKISGWWGR